MVLISVLLWLIKATYWIGILLLPLVIAYYFYLKHRASYFSNLGLPQPPITSLFLGNFEEYEKDNKNHEKLQEWQRIYGSTFGMQQGGHHVIVTSDLELLHEVFIKQFHVFQARQMHPSILIDQEHGKQLTLFTSQGNRWKRLRALFSSTLTIQKIKSVDPIINTASKELVEVLRKHEGGVVDIVPKMLDYTFAVISRSAMGINHKFGENHYLETLLQIINQDETVKSKMACFFAGTIDFLPITKYLQIITIFTFLKAFGELNRKLDESISKRENESAAEKAKRPADFMDFMMEAVDDTLDTTYSSTMDIKVTKKLTRGELIASAQGFLIGGADTTATLLTYCLYELAKNPDVEKLVVQEIGDFIKSEDDINYNTVKDLEYLDRFIKEVSRLHPFAFAAETRKAIAPTTITDSQGATIKIDKGVNIQPNPWSMAQDEAIWGPDTKSFNPDRFLPENSQNRHPMAMILFGAGMRICPGKNLALHETKVTLIHLLREFKLEFCNETTFNERTHIFTNFDQLKMKVMRRR